MNCRRAFRAELTGIPKQPLHLTAEAIASRERRVGPRITLPAGAVAPGKRRAGGLRALDPLRNPREPHAQDLPLAIAEHGNAHRVAGLEVEQPLA